jgi:hypothetical protein
MIKHLILNNVGPAKKMELEFASRLNVFTGDNGLGKSFLLDIVWWALTRTWPAEINPKLTVGQKAQPQSSSEASIDFSFIPSTPNKKKADIFRFNPKDQAWISSAGRPANPGLVLYAMVDGSFAVWDPARNYKRTRKPEAVFIKERPAAYVLNPSEVWGGLEDENGKWLCNGLIRDWANWQREKNGVFDLFKNVLISLSPSIDEQFEPGELTRIDLDDVRDVPTIKMPYKQDVPIIHLSSAMRRILALAYLLVWAWEEHRLAAKHINEPQTRHITLLIDEIEAHLHPRWQRNITKSLFNVMSGLNYTQKKIQPLLSIDSQTDLEKDRPEVQLLFTTHAPLVMASLEPLFDDKHDAWFELDLKANNVTLSRREFEKQGDANNWLTSEAFDLSSPVSEEAQKVIKEAEMLLDKKDTATADEVRSVHSKLANTLPYDSDFLSTWRYFWKKQGHMQ